MSGIDWISPVDRARMGNNNDVMTRILNLESDNNRNKALGVKGGDLQDLSDDLGLARSGAIYFGSGDPYDLTTAPNGMLAEALGIHIYNAVEIARFGDLNGFLTYVVSTYGIGIGNLNAYLTYDPINGLRIKGTVAVFGLFPEGFDVWEEPITGANGVSTTFQTHNSFIAGTLQIIRNGLWMKGGGTDYTELTGAALNMVIPPETGDLLRVNYVRADTGAAVYNETPTGTINGINVNFTTANTPVPGSFMVFLNGVTLLASVDYTSGNETFSTVVAPQASDVFWAAYNAGNNPKFVPQETPSGAINSSNTVFTLANNYQAGTPIVVLNGLKQVLTSDYTESGANQLTFVNAPVTGDSLWVTYLKV